MYGVLVDTAVARNPNHETVSIPGLEIRDVVTVTLESATMPLPHFIQRTFLFEG